MLRAPCFMALAFFVASSLVIVKPAYSLSANYSYEGSNFTEVEGEPDVFSTDDRVTAKIAVDCNIAHAAGNCANLPFQNYFEMGAVTLIPNSFSAGPASLPSPDGDVTVNRFSFSTDSSGRIVDWDMDLVLEDAAGPLNVDTDNSGTGLDSAAAFGAFARVTGAPGTWKNDLPPIDYDSDISVEKSVDNPVPSDPQQTVEFTIEVTNNGAELAENVVVTDKLPEALVIPDGMAAFTSAGDYDPVTGQWTIGELGAGETQVMSIPALIATDPQPACIVNSAVADRPGDPDQENNSSSAALRRPDIPRCVDLYPEVSDWYQVSYNCQPEGEGEMIIQLRIINAGPDEAQNVVMVVSETLFQAPGFSIDAPNCDGLRCVWPTIEAGGERWVLVSTEGFHVDEPTEHGIQVLVTSNVEDYNTENNILVDQHTITLFRPQSCEPPDFNLNIGGSGGGCFIATAAYGSILDPHVKILREFRDNVLMKSRWGQTLVEYYYRYSPGLASVIAKHDGLRTLTRGLLAPVIVIVAYPWQALVIFILLSVLLLGYLRTTHSESRL